MHSTCNTRALKARAGIKRSRGAPPPLPLAFYVDGVSFTRTDSCVGFFIYNVVTGTRILCATLRKSELCACGCRGWCSVSPVLSMIRWSVLALQQGTWPEEQPNNEPWDPENHVSELSFGGSSFGFQAVLLFLKDGCSKERLRWSKSPPSLELSRKIGLTLFNCPRPIWLGST